MKIGLKQIDGKWANLALMKISAWHKAQGDQVEWFSPLWKHDRVYASKIFVDSPDDGYLLKGTIKGGSGYDLQTKLPDEIEQMFPDYSIYPDVEYAIGYTTRGCPRKCPFCIVPQKEGKLKVVGDIYDFWNGQKRIRLLDSNLTAAPLEHFEKITEQCKSENIKVDFSQGLDLRLLRNEHCLALKGIRVDGVNCQIHFAWDRLEDEPQILRGLTIFGSHFPLNRAMLYVLIGFDTSPEQDMYRVDKLREIGVDSFVMPFDRKDSYQKRFARWVNHKAIFKSVSWKDYH